ncbi:hypothetical protein CRH09_08615 [Nocardia terpenica]|uniref:Uncharacterized protein n=1 Tax=Nocardia terpenica TaxID=455432 RepID=A0A291RG22_9NOCA|nr:hypothetical protein CRH09_08615 [Nocardia terpenica]
MVVVRILPCLRTVAATASGRTGPGVEIRVEIFALRPRVEAVDVHPGADVAHPPARIAFDATYRATREKPS